MPLTTEEAAGRVKGLARRPSGPSLAPDVGEGPGNKTCLQSHLHLENGTTYAEHSPGVDLGITEVLVLTDSRMEGRELSARMHE